MRLCIAYSHCNIVCLTNAQRCYRRAVVCVLCADERRPIGCYRVRSNPCSYVVRIYTYYILLLSLYLSIHTKCVRTINDTAGQNARVFVTYNKQIDNFFYVNSV